MIDYSRCLIRVALSSQILFEMFTEGWNSGRVKCVSGLPKGARFIDSYFDANEHIAYLIFQHDAFAGVPEGEVIPVLPIMFERAKAA